MNFNKIAIANRGEIAVRIIQACHELNIKTVLLHSEADINSDAYNLSDENICIGGALSSESYLNIEANIQGALSLGAQAIHPGFGFLSENFKFAQACNKNKLIFIGPDPNTMESFADKLQAKKIAQNAGLPTLPSIEASGLADLEIINIADKITYPVMLKITGGGGGRGLRVVFDEENLLQSVKSIKKEGLNSFSSSDFFIEKFLSQARHIEIQIFVDTYGKVFCLGERDCSVQRKNQKVIEEAPAMGLSEELKKQLYDSAINLVNSTSYKGAGTVEFLVSGNQFYFLEMNTRLQVEHHVTDLVYSVDLVKAQILTAQNKSLSWNEKQLSSKGHSIECRIYAEDPETGIPSLGVIEDLKWGQGSGRHFHSGISKGSEITSYYDAMIAKVIVYDETRTRAINKIKLALKESVIFGIKTNIPTLLKILSSPEFILGEVNTQFLSDCHFEEQKFSTLKDNKDFIVSSILKKIKNNNTGSNTDTDVKKDLNPWLVN
ncbi:MAG: ATP-grasp domain-containing protein [Bdellovibrionales bacterium]|nr:ATP-grasp domain-containing protein [Bdellovibrionales bacterium]